MKKYCPKRGWLLGKTKTIHFYLEPAKWECGWYWGFGYIEGYYKGRSWVSHTYKTDLLHYFFEWNGVGPYLEYTPFSEKEQWDLVELFRRFHIYRDLADLLHRGFTGVVRSQPVEADIPADLVNKVWIPKVIAKIYCILDPHPKSEEEYIEELVKQVK